MGPFSPLWHVLLLSPSLRPTVDTTDTVDTDIVDTDTVDTTEERGLLMPNLRLKLPPLLHPKLKLRLNPTTDTDTVDTMAVPTDTDTDTVTLAKDLLMLNPKLKLKPNPTTDTDTVDTMVDTVATTAVDTTGVEMDTSG